MRTSPICQHRTDFVFLFVFVFFFFFSVIYLFCHWSKKWDYHDIVIHTLSSNVNVIAFLRCQVFFHLFQSDHLFQKNYVAHRTWSHACLNSESGHVPVMFQTHIFYWTFLVILVEILLEMLLEITLLTSLNI